MTRLSAVALLSLLSVQGGEAAPGSGHKNVLHIIVDGAAILFLISLFKTCLFFSVVYLCKF